jgi:large subunit ribosomal protein L35|uniref:Large ribosomal subunit protein bL35c n=1 Tax=Guillardia theta TaxID=55529 RepID=A0A0U2HL18_GUITH|nr:ribosomal protein L35 [Guillardia theta]|tara:strand:+ start:3326 stop:3523 length:198 start_codon:yes stop_codon:yes gene_type:complete
MPKLKTKKSVLKRFKRTVNGKFMRKKAGKGHILEKKSSKRKRCLSQKAVVSFGHSLVLPSLLPYL